ncbi:MAG: sensor histidine kinase [Alphaproteobacteria bacterium]
MTWRSLQLPGFATSLSARLLVLTIIFVMVSELLIFFPSIARFRISYLQEHINAAHVATLALEATPTLEVRPELEEKLLDNARVDDAATFHKESATYILRRTMPTPIEIRFDLREGNFFTHIRDAVNAMSQKINRVMQITGTPTTAPAATVRIVMDEQPLREAMYEFSGRVLALSIFISLITASLVYIALHRLLVRPMRRITASMVAFRESPEDATHRPLLSNRKDEIGIAQQELARMQEELRAALTHKTRLAALGEGVAKIHHDLRNILSTASLVSDRLSFSNDPEVKRVAPRLLDAIDRAVKLCTQTLLFANEGAPPLQISQVSLRNLVDEVGAGLVFAEKEGRLFAIDNRVPTDFVLEIDRDQFYRALTNLARNAVEAGAHWLTVSATLTQDGIAIDVADDGPGIPAKIRDRLFQPFAGSTRSGGTGLGLAISRDLLEAHGGGLSLVETSEKGTVFRIHLPKKIHVPSRRRLFQTGGSAA